MTASAETLACARGLTGRLPDFFIVGHAKSGTTALYEMLRGHPQVFMPDLKETRFFSREHPHPGNRGPYPDTLEESRRQSRTNSNSPGLQYTERVRYVEQLRRYQDAFSRAQLLVLIYEDFRRDNLATVRRVLSFLEVDDESPIQPLEANPTVRVRSPRLYGLVRSVYLGRGGAPRVAKSVIKSLAPRQLRVKALETTRRRFLYARPSPPDEQLTLELRRRFKGEVEALSDYLSRDLVTLWGYGDID